MSPYNELQQTSEDDMEKQSEDQLLPSSYEDLAIRARPSAQRTSSFVLLCTLLLISLAAAFWAGSVWEASKTIQKCFELVSIRSPVKNDIDPATKLVRFNGSLDWPSPYRGTPSPKIDAAWEKIEKVGFLSISEEDIVNIGASKDAIRVPEAYGGGYLGQLELTHKMHCINFLRKGLFTNYEYYQDTLSFKDPPEILRTHLEHCVEIIRQDILCHADPGVFTAHWIENYPRPYANFNVWKVCHNWENVLGWAKDRAIPDPEHWSDIMLEDSVKWTRPPQPEQFGVPPPFP